MGPTVVLYPGRRRRVDAGGTQCGMVVLFLIIIIHVVFIMVLGFDFSPVYIGKERNGMG